MSDARAKQALYMAKKTEREGSVRAGIWRAVFLFGVPIAALAVLIWWVFFA